jgi:hypothetical protein
VINKIKESNISNVLKNTKNIDNSRYANINRTNSTASTYNKYVSRKVNNVNNTDFTNITNSQTTTSHDGIVKALNALKDVLKNYLSIYSSLIAKVKAKGADSISNITNTKNKNVSNIFKRDLTENYTSNISSVINKIKESNISNVLKNTRNIDNSRYANISKTNSTASTYNKYMSRKVNNVVCPRDTNINNLSNSYSRIRKLNKIITSTVAPTMQQHNETLQNDRRNPYSVTNILGRDNFSLGEAGATTSSKVVSYDFSGLQFKPEIKINGSTDKKTIIDALREYEDEFMDMLEEFIKQKESEKYA